MRYCFLNQALKMLHSRHPSYNRLKFMSARLLAIETTIPVSCWLVCLCKTRQICSWFNSLPRLLRISRIHWTAFCNGNSPATGGLPARLPCNVERGALIFSLICALDKRLSKQSWGWWFEMPSRTLWRHCNGALSEETVIINANVDWYGRSRNWSTVAVDQARSF